MKTKRILIAARAQGLASAIAIITFVNPVHGQLWWTNPPAEVAVFAARASNVIKALNLRELREADTVGQILFTNLIGLSRWHDSNSVFSSHADTLTNAGSPMPTNKSEIRFRSPELDQWRSNLFNQLSMYLTPDQIEVVKEQLTQRRMTVTYRAYCESNPTLTESQKATILDLLHQAREEALVAGSSEEKDKIFRKYKGRINNFLHQWKTHSSPPPTTLPTLITNHVGGRENTH